MPEPEKRIKMPPCRDCGQPWDMPESEKIWWDGKIKSSGYKMPKRCQKCREANRKGIPHGNLKLDEIVKELKAMSEKAINDEYEGNAHQLSQDLMDLANKLGQYHVGSEFETGERF